MTNEITRTPAIDATINANDPHQLRLELRFANGEALHIGREELSTAIIEQALIHGLKQKLVDAAAISRNPDTGRSATIDDKYNAVKEVYDRLLSGQWNKTREGGSVKGGLLFRALCILYTDKTPEAIRAFLEKKTAAEKTELRKLGKIRDIIATFKEESDDSIDADALLGELAD